MGAYQKRLIWALLFGKGAVLLFFWMVASWAGTGIVSSGSNDS